MKTVKLRKKEKASLLLLRIPVLRAASNTSPHARLRLRMFVLAVVVSRWPISETQIFLICRFVTEIVGPLVHKFGQQVEI